MKLLKRRTKPARKSRRRNVLERLETRKLFAADFGFAPPDMLATPYAFVGDHSPSNSEKWSMKVGQTTLQASDFGEVERQRLSLEKGKSYPITVSHIDTNIEEDGGKKPDYDCGMMINPGQSYSASPLGLSPGSSTTFYLEAVRASRRTKYFDAIDVTIDVSGYWSGTLEDTLHARGVMPPQGNLTISTKHSGETKEEDETDPFKTTLPSCGCEFPLAIADVNDVARNGTLTLDYPADALQVRDLSGNLIEPGSVVDIESASSFTVVAVTETAGGTIDLNYAGRAGVRTLDSIAFNVPQRDLEIDLRVAAFIPLSKGRSVEFRGFLPEPDELGAMDVNWIKEPGSVPNPGVFYGTNDRENPGDPGTSKIAVNATIDAWQIGNFEAIRYQFAVEKSTTYRALVHKENPGDVHWIDGRTVEKNDQTPAITETPMDLAEDRSTIQIIASAGYPYTPAPLTQKIDFDITFTLQVLADCSVEVTIESWRNDFPAYEVMIDGNVIHSYVAPDWDGPNPINLNAWTNISGSFIAKPSYLEDQQQ